MKTQKISIKIPFIKSFEDYHEIRCFAEDLSSVSKIKIKHFEITDSNNFDGYYYGLFYTGTKPTKKDIENLKKKNISL